LTHTTHFLVVCIYPQHLQFAVSLTTKGFQAKQVDNSENSMCTTVNSCG